MKKYYCSSCAKEIKSIEDKCSCEGAPVLSGDLRVIHGVYGDTLRCGCGSSFIKVIPKTTAGAYCMMCMREFDAYSRDTVYSRGFLNMPKPDK